MSASPAPRAGPFPHLRRFTRDYIAPYAWWFALGTAAVLATNWLAVHIPLALATAVDALGAGDLAAVRAEGLRVIGYALAIIVARTFSRVWFFTPARRVEFDLREDLFATCLRQQPGFYARYPTGDLLSRATSDVTFARAFAGFATLQAVNVVSAFTMSLGQMIATSPALSLVVAVPVGLGYAMVQYGASRLFALQRLAQEQVAAFADDFLGTLQGVATVQAFCAESAFVARLDARAQDLRRSNLRLAQVRAVVFPLLGVAGGVGVALLLFVGGGMAARGEITTGELAAFVALLGFLLVPLRMLGVLLPVFQRAEASLERIHRILDEPVDRPEGTEGRPVPEDTTIELRGLTVAWPEAPDRPVLRNVTARVPPGTVVGIFGRTGSGKTTLLRVLARLVNPPPGTVFLGGADVRTLDLDALRKALVLVPQVPFLFGESIAANVALGGEPARVQEALRLASLAPDLAALPQGDQTVVGERGIVLSGGQRQRVALARGLARSGRIVLLDDVLSAVDHHTEQELLDMLDHERRGATRFLVSHRMSALARCDVIWVLDGGELVARGTHGQLLARPGPYRDAWEAQEAT